MADRYQPWTQEQENQGPQDEKSWQGRERRQQGAFSQGGGHDAQHATGYGSHGYGGQTSGPSLQTGYGAQGSSGYEGGPGYGLPGDYGSHRGARTERSGGYGPHGAGYGSQSSYASHGGYGSPGQRWQTGYGGGGEGQFRSQGYGTHAGYGSQSGYGPQGDAHWPQSSWAQQGHAHKRGPKGYTRSDERIREDLCERLMEAAFIDSSEVTIEVSAGKIVIDGTVPERRMKHAIEDMAVATLGVNDVENKVRVGQSAAPGEWAGSSAATGKKE